MCTNKRYITNALGQMMCVPCGHCPSCLQEKAIKRANKIRNNYPSDGSKVAFFVTLTYRNATVPYIDMREITRSKSYFEQLQEQGKPIPVDMSDYKIAKVYRDCTVRWVRDVKKVEENGVKRTINNGVKRKVKFGREVLTSVVIPLHLLHESKLMYLQNQSKPKVSVCYYKDLQNFIKRLRINLTRKYGYHDNFTYYMCTEYGPNTQRSHAHLLIFAPLSTYKLFKTAINEAWSLDDYHQAGQSIEVARDAASYVSSYVNCVTTIPPLLRESEEIRPSNSYSKGFGLARLCLSLDEVCKAYDRRDLRYDVCHVKNKTLLVERMLFPPYVVSRYFRKFKGYSRLTPDEIKSICLDPKNLLNFRYKLGYNDDDIRHNYVMLCNLITRFSSSGRSQFEFARIYSDIWALYSSNVLGDFYDNIYLSSDNFTAYDNIKSFYASEIMSPSLDDLFVSAPPEHCETDFNQFPFNVAKTRNLEHWFHEYSKDKKVRNYAYSRAGYNM